MDESFLPLHALLPDLLPLVDPVGGPDQHVRTIITGCEVRTPVELDITVGGASGRDISIGSAPPLYHVDTSELPVLHTIRVTVVSTATVSEESGS